MTHYQYSVLDDRRNWKAAAIKRAARAEYGILTLIVLWGTLAFAQGKGDPAQLRAEIDKLTNEQMEIALSIQLASPDIQQGSSPQTTYLQAGSALEADFERNERQRSAVDSECHRTVQETELAAAERACAAVRVPFNQRLDELIARKKQLQRLDELSDQIQGLHLKLAGMSGVQCSECGTDNTCWTRCFDGSKDHTGAVTVPRGTPFFSTQEKAERDRKAIQAYLNSGAIPSTRVKVWAKPPPSP